METGELDISSPSEMTKVSVAVRVRPLIEREKKGDAQIHWQIGPQELRPFDAEAKRIVPNSSTYTYDHVFTQSTQTQQVYDKVVSPIVKQAFKGFNGTILCYGQTSSGKTHTLYGSNDDKGIILLFADHLFQQIKADETRRQYIIKVGLIEIYNEKVSDLLNSYNPIELQERDGSIVPHGLEELTVFDIDDWKKVTERVQRERKIGETRMNKESSRSHTILRVTIESFDLTSNGSFDEAQENSEQSPPLTTAVLHFVDLAGSEKQSQTGAEGERFREQVNINMSLSVLSRVIQQLSEQASVSAFEGRSSSNDHSLAKAMVNSMVRTAPRPRFINFRDSKLTRLLQSSLNGNAYISMVCNVTIASFEETKSTLLFAQQAKKIQIRPKQNFCSTKSEYENKLQELQELLNSKDKEVLVLRRQCENMKRAFEFRDEQSTQRTTNVDRRLSLCPTMFRPTSTKPRHSNPEPMTQFAYYKNKYASSSKLSSPMDEFMSADEFVKSLRSPLKSVPEAIGSDVICLDKEVQTDIVEAEGGLSSLHTLATILESDSEGTQNDQQVQTDDQEDDSKTGGTPARPAPRRVTLDGTPVSTLRLNNALLRTVNEEDRQEWEEQKAYLELENAELREEVNVIPTLKNEIEALKLEKLELENDVMRQIQASRVEINRRIAESPEALEWKKKLDDEVDKREKERELMNSEMDTLKEKLKSYYELQPKLTELQDAMSTLILANEKLENERALRDEKAKETELEHQEMEEGLQAIIESKMTELRERDEEIKQLQSSLQDKSQERCNLDSDLLEAEKLINSLKSAKLQLDGELAAQQSAYEAIEIVVQKLRQDLASVQEKQDLERQDKEENIRKLSLITKEHENCQNWAEDRKTLENQNHHLITTLAELREEVQQRLTVIEKTDVETQAFSLSIEEMKDELVLISSEAEAQRLRKEETIERMDRIAHDHDHCEDHITQLKISLEQQDRIIADKLTVEAELKLKQAAYDEAKSLAHKMSEKLMEMENKYQEDLSLELVEAQSLINSLESAKVELEEELVAQQNAYETIKISAQKMQEDLAFLQEKRAVEIQENNENTQKLDMISKEHESCQNLAEDLKMMENHIQQLMTEKAELEQRLKQQKAVIEKAEAESQAFNLSVQEMKDELVLIKSKEETLRREKEETTEKMNLVLQEHDKCQDLVIELKTTRDQLDKIIVDKLALEEQLKSQQEAYDEAESVVLKMSEKLETMEENYEAGLKAKDDKVEKMTAILKEHENCQLLAEDLKMMKNHIQQLTTEKAELEQLLKQVVIDKAEAESQAFHLSVQEMKDELVLIKDKEETLRREKEETIEKMNLVLQEHDMCQHLVIELKTTRDQLDKIIVDKLALEEQLKSQQEAYDEAESVVVKMSEKLEIMEENYEAGLKEKDDKVERMTAILKEHEKCQDLSKELQTTRDQLETIIAEKVAVEKQLKAQHNDYQINAQSIIEKMKKELTTMQASAVAERHDKEDTIKRMNMISKQHEHCLDQSAELNTARDQVEQLMADKAALDERLKAQHETYEVCQLTIQKMKEELASVERKTVAERLEKEDTIKKMNIIVKQHEHCQDFSTDLEIAKAQVVKVSADNADWEIRFEAQRVAYDAELECVKHHAQEVFEEMSEKISELNVVVQEHEKCQNLAINYKTLSAQVDELRADKIALEGRLNMDRSALASVMESIKRKEAELYDKEQEIKQLNKIVEEHGSCQEKEANYLLHQTLLQSLKADKVKLKEQLKAQQDAYEAAELSIQTMKQELSMKQLEIKERDMNIDKLNRVLEDHENCDAVYSDLHTARLNFENLLAVKEELEERVKALENSYEKAQSTARQLKVELDSVQEPGKPGRGVVVTRGTQCDDIASELDQYKDATKHYRNRAHKAEFELQRVQKALGQKDEDTQSPEPRRAPIPPPPPPKPQRSGVTTSSKVETGVQCTLLNELIGQSTKSELGGLSVCIPELAQLHGDLKLTKIALDNAKLELAKYTSKSKPQSVIGAGKPTENVAKYNKPSGFQKKMAFFQGGSTRMNTKEGVILPGNQPRVPKDLQPGPVEEKVETKITHVSPKDLEDIENAPEPIQATPPAEEEPEDDFSWLMQLVKKKT
ncbi:unnamed protein product [Orchesella dallaii]|uniref:Kinesin motor domain-containing protein n=1 Tax=Orchesella dallaii TaxID=48710 RepID=A0ABP1PYG2_9HEXA